MSEVNKNTYLNYGGLQTYHGLIKEFIAKQDDIVLSNAIAAFDAKLGEFDGSDDMTVAAIIEDIRGSIVSLISKDGELAEKDAELEGKIAEEIGKIVGDLGESDSLTLGNIADQLKSLNDSVSKNAGDIADVQGRVTTLEGTIEDLKNLGGDNGLVAVVDKVNANVTAIEKLNGEVDVEGSVKKTAADAADAALEEAKGYADSLAGNYDAAGSAADALEDAKDYADGLATNYDAAGSAAAAETAAKAYAEKLTNIYDAAGSAADALEDAKDYADGLATNYDAAGSAAAAQSAAVATAAEDASTKSAAALAAAKKYVDDIAHASDVKYVDGRIKLYAGEAELGVGFDASPFIVEGMLKSVDFVKDADGKNTTTLRFTFIEDGENKEIDVDFKDYVDVYAADGTSISLENNTFSVKEVAATKTKTVDAIPVAGGPLESLLKGAGITEIAAGSSIEDILFSLICKELWAQSLTFSEGTVGSSIAQPSFTLSNSGTTVEVGTKCTLSEITMGAATASVTKNRTYSGFTYGYSKANDNSQYSADSTITAEVTVAAALNEGNYTMSRDYTKFNNAVDDSATANADASQVKLDGAELTVSFVGTNSVKVTVGGPTASATFGKMPVYYACSNLKKTKDADKDSEGQYKSVTKEAKEVTSSAASNSKTLSVTGARAYWMGSLKNAMDINSIDSAVVRAAGESETDHVTKTLGANPVNTVKATGGDAQVIIATQKEITKVTSENQINANVFDNFDHKSVTIEGANGFDGISYHLYTWAPANPFDKDDTLTITYK